MQEMKLLTGNGNAVQYMMCIIIIVNRFGPWTKSQAGLVSCLEPQKDIT